MRRVVTLAALALAAGLAAGPLQAQQTAKEAEPMPDFDLYKPFRSPGEAHRVLDPLVGTWEAELAAWQHGSPPPQISLRSRLETAWVLEERFLRTSVRHIGEELKIEGLYFTGFDTRQESYFSILLPNDDTIATHNQVSWDPDARTFTFHAEERDAVTGDVFHKREIFTLKGSDELAYELRFRFADGSEIKAMEGVYRRVN